MIANVYASRKHGVHPVKKQLKKEYNKLCGELKVYTIDNYTPTIKPGYTRIVK